MLNRLKRALEAGKTAVAEDQVLPQPILPDLMSEPAQAAPTAEPDPLLGLLMLNDVGPAAPELTQKHLKAAKSAGTRALFIVGAETEMDFFADRTLLCEYLPSHQDIFRATEERPDVIALYRQYRFQLILDKWRVTDCRWVGEDAADLIAQTKLNGQRPIRFRKM
jgi:hypothetical protein